MAQGQGDGAVRTKRRAGIGKGQIVDGLPRHAGSGNVGDGHRRVTLDDEVELAVGRGAEVGGQIGVGAKIIGYKPVQHQCRIVAGEVNRLPIQGPCQITTQTRAVAHGQGALVDGHITTEARIVGGDEQTTCAELGQACGASDVGIHGEGGARGLEKHAFGAAQGKGHGLQEGLRTCDGEQRGIIQAGVGVGDQTTAGQRDGAVQGRTKGDSGTGSESRISQRDHIGAVH